MNIAKHHLPTVVAAMPDLAFSAIFLAAWIVPGVFGTERIADLVSAMVLEFFVIHSSFFMAGVIHDDSPPLKKATGVFFLGLFYSVILGGISFSSGNWFLLAAFWILIVNRMMESLRKGPSIGGEMKALTTTAWIANAIFYIIAVTITSILPVPDFGQSITIDSGDSSGLWVEEPQRAMATGFLYFGASGFFHFRIQKWTAIASQIKQKR